MRHKNWAAVAQNT